MLTLDEQANWFQYLSPWQRDLVATSYTLSQKFDHDSEILDFSFIIFPMAKAYEGFLKKMLLDLALITEHTYQSRRFRIGRALNPDIRHNQRDAWWLYDDVELKLGKEVARAVWQAWLKCRNHIFHFFPNGERHTDYSEAEACLRRMELVISQVADKIKDINRTKNDES